MSITRSSGAVPSPTGPQLVSSNRAHELASVIARRTARFETRGPVVEHDGRRHPSTPSEIRRQACHSETVTEPDSKSTESESCDIDNAFARCSPCPNVEKVRRRRVNRTTVRRNHKSDAWKPFGASRQSTLLGGRHSDWWRDRRGLPTDSRSGRRPDLGRAVSRG